jgi:hypothetical protein
MHGVGKVKVQTKWSSKLEKEHLGENLKEMN